MNFQKNKLVFIGQFFLVVLLWTAAADAHDEAPIYPVEVTLTLNPTEIKIHLESNALYWVSEVLFAVNDPLPANHWDPAYVDLAKAYIAQHLQLFVDSQPLVGTHVECFYKTEPIATDDSRVLFDLVYPWPSVPVLSTSVLRGKIDFFSEEAAHLAAEKKKSSEEELLANVTIRGKNLVQIKVPGEDPFFSLPLKDQIRSATQVRYDQMLSFVRTALISSPFWLFCLGLLLIIFRKKTEPYGLMAAGISILAAVVQIVMNVMKR